MPLDVTIDAQSDAAFELLRREWGELDIVVHAVAYAPREALTGRSFRPRAARAFRVAHEVSSYSLTAPRATGAPFECGPPRKRCHADLSRLRMLRSGIQRHGSRQGEPGGERAFLAADLGPQGIRVNAISAGPIKTLAARHSRGFEKC